MSLTFFFFYQSSQDLPCLQCCDVYTVTKNAFYGFNPKNSLNALTWILFFRYFLLSYPESSLLLAIYYFPDDNGPCLIFLLLTLSTGSSDL